MYTAEFLNKIWFEEGFKEKFLENPTKILQQEGIEIPEDLKVIVHENTDKEMHYVIPEKPEGELSEEELEAISGGYYPNVSMWGSPTRAHKSIGGPYPAEPQK